jgi:hypothetical protein
MYMCIHVSIYTWEENRVQPCVYVCMYARVWWCIRTSMYVYLWVESGITYLSISFFDFLSLSLCGLLRALCSPVFLFSMPLQPTPTQDTLAHSFHSLFGFHISPAFVCTSGWWANAVLTSACAREHAGATQERTQHAIWCDAVEESGARQNR